jgi:GDPmannose 4,6-dehydratase
VRDFVAAAASELDMRIEWKGKGVEEVGIDSVSGKTLVHVDPRYFRPTEVETLLGDASKARHKLGWAAEVSFSELVAEMVQSDLELAKRDSMVAKEGYKVYKHHE